MAKNNYKSGEIFTLNPKSWLLESQEGVHLKWYMYLGGLKCGNLVHTKKVEIYYGFLRLTTLYMVNNIKYDTLVIMRIGIFVFAYRSSISQKCFHKFTMLIFLYLKKMKYLSAYLRYTSTFDNLSSTVISCSLVC